MRVFILLLALSLLTACTTPAPPPFVKDADKTWQQRQRQLATINSWLLNGRMAVLNDDEAWHLNMRWQRQDGDYVLDLSGPFGSGHAQLRGGINGVLLKDSAQNVFYADSPDELLQKLTHFRIPVQSLQYWIYGIPDKAIKISRLELDGYGRLALLQQNGWKVVFKKYMPVAQHVLPQKIFITGFDMKVKIFIDDWNLQPQVLKAESEEG